MTDTLQDARTPPRRIGAARIAIGFVAGMILWLLHDASTAGGWTRQAPGLFGALVAVVSFLPFVLVGGIPALRVRTLLVWAPAAAALLALLGWHDLWRRGEAPTHNLWLTVELMTFGAAGLFVAHELVAAGDAERRFLARYPTYFETAWKHGVQLALSAAFVGVFWLLLWLGAALFDVIGIEAVRKLIEKKWFAFPATGAMFAAAVQLTDVRVGLIRGIRTVALTLLSWLLPVLALLAAAFLLALPFTGLDPLWKTRSAAGILLSAAATLIVLINAAYQDGEPDGIVPIVLRMTTRVAACTLAPLVILSGYALWLRIGQHGLTPDRVVGVACTIAGAVYAAGYLVAAVRPGRWMRRLEATNLIAAFVVLGLLLAIFTPIADPARLSVDNQMARLAAGKVTPEKFDYLFLRFDGQRYGQEALKTLAAKGGEAGGKATAALARVNRWEPMRGDIDAPARGDPKTLRLGWPSGAALPADFLETGWLQGDAKELDCTVEAPCPAALVDLNGDGKDEVLVAGRKSAVVLSREGRTDWRNLAQTDLALCPRFAEDLRAGRVETAPSEWRDLVVGGKRLGMDSRRNDCEADPPVLRLERNRAPPAVGSVN